MPDDAPDPTYRPGWYPDPLGRYALRFHNGERWTADVSAEGARYVDPYGIDPHGTVGHGTGPGHPGRDRASGPATAAMVLGIVGVTTAWMPFLVAVGIVTGLLAIVFGTVALRRGAVDAPRRGRAVAGVALGTSALVASILGVLLTVLVVDVYDDFVNPEPHEVAIEECALAGSRATAIGELTNLGERTADFNVVIGFVRPGTRNVRATASVELLDVAPGDTVTFEAQRQVPLDEVECVVREVTGALPFGIALD